MKRAWKRARTVTAPRLGPAELRRADERLLLRLERDFAEAARRAGERLACRPGCSECCIGPFPVTRLDAWRLRRGLAELERTDPARAAALLERARAAVSLLAESYPGDPAIGRLEAGAAQLDRFFQRHGSLACPVLDPGSGRCDLYAWRPVACRIYGPPARFGEQESPPCRLCFEGAPPEEIEACRMEPDREGLEQRVLAGMGVTGGDDWETLIPFPLLDSKKQVRLVFSGKLV
jgi:Fe-S-cluster containining protein